MKIIPLVCPKCGGAINITNKGAGIYKCPFCDSPIYFDDGIERSESKIDINFKSDTIDRTEIQKNKDELDYTLKIAILPIILFIVFTVLLVVLAMIIE